MRNIRSAAWPYDTYLSQGSRLPITVTDGAGPRPTAYRLIEEVGQGGMAVVYRAKDDTLKREVAIKILHRHLAGEPESKARLEREAQAVAKLRHENILEIFDYSGGDAESSYIVTEFIDGADAEAVPGRSTIALPRDRRADRGRAVRRARRTRTAWASSTATSSPRT